MNRLRVPLFLALILILTLLILPVKASSFVGYVQADTPGAANCFDGTFTTCDGNNGTDGFIGEAVQAPFTGQITVAAFFSGSLAPNRVAILTLPPGTSPTNTQTTSCAPTSGSSKVDLGGAGSNGYPFTLQDYEVLSGISTFSYVTVTLASPVSVVANQWVLIGVKAQGVAGINMLKNAIGGTCHSQYIEVSLSLGSNPTIGSTFVSAGNIAAPPAIVGGSFTTTGTIGQVTQCYGNCGSPAVTIANTNSTHTINFNQSITLFYVAQSNLNGFVANVTTRVAKSYTNGEAIAIGLYTVDLVCTASNNPFTPQCPGFLVQQQGLASNPAKGIFSMTSNTAIQNGQWFGIAVTGGFQGLDLNDTNTNVALNQASGQIPTVISQFAGLGTSKLALYAYIRGNSIIIAPGGGQIPAGCQTVTCGILALWVALGGDVAAGIGGFLIVVGLIIGFLLYITRQHNPNGSLKGFAIPMEMLGIVVVVVLIMFSAAGAIPAWIPGIIIFLVAGYFVAGVWGRRDHSNTVEG